MSFEEHKEESLLRLIEFKKDLLILITEIESSMIIIQGGPPEYCDEYKEWTLKHQFDLLKEEKDNITLEYKEWVREDNS